MIPMPEIPPPPPPDALADAGVSALARHYGVSKAERRTSRTWLTRATAAGTCCKT